MSLGKKRENVSKNTVKTVSKEDFFVTGCMSVGICTEQKHAYQGTLTEKMMVTLIISWLLAKEDNN